MLKKSAEDTIGYMSLAGNDPQQTNLVFLFSSVSYRGHGSCITPDTFEHCLTLGAVRRIAGRDWLKEVDQFQAPKGV